jgi:uncharacterized membrane protein YfhO
LLRRETFHARDQIIIEPDFLDTAAASAEVTQASPETAETEVEFTRRGPNRFSVVTHTGGRGWVVVSQNWYPGWEAKVNGKVKPVIRVDGTLMAVAVDGPGQIDFTYTPAGLYGSLAAMLAAALGLVAVLVLARRKQ